MKKSGGKKLIIGLVAAAVLIGVIVFAVRRNGSGPVDPENAVFVESVAAITGMGSSNGMMNRFSGVVESQETWSIEQNQEYSVAEVYVKVGDTVEEGTPLFIYDVEQFNEKLEQSKIDLERLNAELSSMNTTIAELEKEKAEADASLKASYTIQIQQQELEKKQKEYDIKSKQSEIDKLNDNIANATVTSKIAGVVQTINNGNGGQTYYGEDDNSFIKIMKTGDFRVKGTINESNIGEITEGTAMIVHSRVDPEKTWTGTVTVIDRENGKSSQTYYGSDTSAQSTNYPFYVDLDSSEDLMLGQHVYMEINAGQLDESKKTGIWIDEYYVDQTDPEKPVIWAAENGKLKKRAVTLGEHDEELFKVQVLEGLTAEDYIAFPDETMKEGTPTITMEEMAAASEGEDGMAVSGGMAGEGMSVAGAHGVG
ncbi:MAG: efflux RND transporter periplasmic adaptor subunit [Lachnospiraceae bacterium]|nr:efflux RND transporter periplasmic adaptor subunit [Lachnospiraceae bacterium]MEE3377820.1 efflux RND transporter periplasmic adaptor subunit [Lachnospiraceae bacterium]